MITTLDYLANEPSFTSKFAGSVEQYLYPGCAELRWDVPHCGAMTEDTGIVLKTKSRFIVVSLLRSQLRYYAASEDVNDIDYEIGILSDARHACLLAEDYLLNERELLSIHIPRNILRARLEVERDHAIERPNNDVHESRSPAQS